MSDINNLHDELVGKGIPYYMHRPLVEYVWDGKPVGDFLRAVLENDFSGACSYADDKNRHKLYEWHLIIYNYIPADCHGSRAAVNKWIKHGGLRGVCHNCLHPLLMHRRTDSGAYRCTSSGCGCERADAEVRV